jgi:hypothetical protein
LPNAVIDSPAGKYYRSIIRRLTRTLPMRCRKMAESSSERQVTKKTAEQLNDENFRRQNIKFAEKADRLREEFGADVFILVRRKGKLKVYTSRDSLDDPQWPLRPGEIANYYPKLIKTPETLKTSKGSRKRPGLCWR